MTIEKSILEIVPGFQSLAVMGQATKLIPKEDDFLGKGKNSPMKQSKKMVKGFVDITTGVALMGPTSSMINKL